MADSDFIAGDPAFLALRHLSLSLTTEDVDHVHNALIPKET